MQTEKRTPTPNFQFAYHQQPCDCIQQTVPHKADTQITSFSQSINAIKISDNRFVRFQKKEFAFSKTNEKVS